jgi:hypothetical protein
MIAATLKQAKAAHEQGIADAKATLLGAIDAHINAAAGAGDLKTVTALRSAKAAAAVDGTIPADVKDPAILAAKTRYDVTARGVNANLSAAYQAAIREYTRAQKIDEAQAVQAEFEASPLGRPAAAAVTPKPPPVEPPTRLAKLLPALFTATGGFAFKEGAGIEPAKGTSIISKPADFLSPTRDWVFDVWVHVDKKDGWGKVGIGDGKLEGSIILSIRAPADTNHGIALLKGDQWGGKIAGLREPGDYVVRIEKTGPALTFSFGEEKDGQFHADITRTVTDPHDFMPRLSDKSAHLFFSGGLLFKQYRLTFKQPAAPDAAPPAKPAVAVPPPPKKKK